MMPRIAIDVHSHVATPAGAALVAALDDIRNDPFTFYASAETSAYNAEQFSTLTPKLTDPAERIADMDRMGIDVQALSVAPPQYYYWADPELGQRAARLQNEHLAEMVSGHPERFVGLATVPMQDVAAAVTELEYCVRHLGFRGAEISTNIAGRDLDDPRYLPFFAKAEELDVLIVLHPHGFTHGERLRPYYLTNVIGNPLDSTIATSRIIHGGVLEKHPRLKLLIVHGGGYLPFYSSRMDHAYEARPEGRHNISAKPSSYLRKLYFDCLVFDEAHLEFLIKQVGADHVAIGTDYPYDMGYYSPLEQIARAQLTEGQRSAIIGETAARLLNIDGGQQR